MKIYGSVKVWAVYALGVVSGLAAAAATIMFSEWAEERYRRESGQ